MMRFILLITLIFVASCASESPEERNDRRRRQIALYMVRCKETCNGKVKSFKLIVFDRPFCECHP